MRKYWALNDNAENAKDYLYSFIENIIQHDLRKNIDNDTIHGSSSSLVLGQGLLGQDFNLIKGIDK